MLGYDFMLHESGRPFLIEVNANPMLASQASWHGMLVRRLAHDYVSLALDPIFPAVLQPPCPPLDGSHVADWQGSGWVNLVASRSTTPPPIFSAKASKGGYVLCPRQPIQIPSMSLAAHVLAEAANVDSPCLETDSDKCSRASTEEIA